MKKILLYGFKYSNIPERSDRAIDGNFGAPLAVIPGSNDV